MAAQGDQGIDDDQRALLQRMWGEIGQSVVHPDLET